MIWWHPSGVIRVVLAHDILSKLNFWTQSPDELHFAKNIVCGKRADSNRVRCGCNTACTYPAGQRNSEKSSAANAAEIPVSPTLVPSSCRYPFFAEGWDARRRPALRSATSGPTYLFPMSPGKRRKFVRREKHPQRDPSPETDRR